MHTEQIPMQTVRLDLAWISILNVIVGLLVLVFVFAWRRRSRPPLESPSSSALPTSHSRPGFFGEFTWLAAPLIVASTFAGISASESALTGRNGSSPASTAGTQPKSTPKLPVPLGDTPVPTDDRTTTSSADHQMPRPTWVDQPRTVDGDCERIVVASQQYTTREEAEQELLATVSELLVRDLRQLHPESPRASSWHPTTDEIKRHAVKGQYAEVVERDFGNFFHPMYRVWWQVELSPGVRTEFLPAWRRGLTLHRVRWVGAIATSLALAASVLAIYRRLNVQTHGAGRTGLRLLVAAVAVLWWIAISIAARHWLS
jgi:hypothetical protein